MQLSELTDSCCDTVDDVVMVIVFVLGAATESQLMLPATSANLPVRDMTSCTSHLYRMLQAFNFHTLKTIISFLCNFC